MNQLSISSDKWLVFYMRWQYIFIIIIFYMRWQYIFIIINFEQITIIKFSKMNIL